MAQKKKDLPPATGKNNPPAKSTARQGKSSDPFKKIAGVPLILPGKPVEIFSLLTDEDIRLFQAGIHFRIYEKMGSHLTELGGIGGVYFAVWAPSAEGVSVMGNFNNWNPYSHALYPRWDHSGIWEGFIPQIGKGELYKYHIRALGGEELDKGDPYSNYWELRPRTASRVWDLAYDWKDGAWMKSRRNHNSLTSPFAVYEVHLGSWRRPDPSNHESFYSYTELAELLVPYVKDMGFTHVEFMPLTEHPFDGSWGYQATGFYAPTSRYGTPQEFMGLVEAFHRAGIGVILDWVPSHFPYDSHGLFRFDGSHVYEYADMRKGFHKDWNSYIFNYARSEVRSFLMGSALLWLDKFHIDGLRVDAVASMIHLDYSRKQGEWQPNELGGNENLEAVLFLRELNQTIYAEFPDTQTIAEESTSFFGVSRPVYMGGLGFGMKWMMGWMNDTLDYFKRDIFFRRWHQDQITFSIVYAFSENFMLPLSHDEVVHGKSPMVYKMPGDDWQKFANLRTMYTYMYTHPGTKLLFMGDEIAQTTEWNFRSELGWHLLQHESHRGLQQLVRDLNKLYRTDPALYLSQFDQQGFRWVETDNREQCVLAYLRIGGGGELLVALNLTPDPRRDYQLGMEEASSWSEVLNSDHGSYWGSGNFLNPGSLATTPVPHHAKPYTLTVQIPPLGAIVLRRVPNRKSSPNPPR